MKEAEAGVRCGELSLHAIPDAMTIAALETQKQPKTKKRKYSVDDETASQ